MVSDIRQFGGVFVQAGFDLRKSVGAGRFLRSQAVFEATQGIPKAFQGGRIHSAAFPASAGQNSGGDSREENSDAR